MGFEAYAKLLRVSKNFVLKKSLCFDFGKFGVSKKVWFRNIWPIKKMKQNDKKKTKTNSKVKGLSFVSTPSHCDAYRT